MTLRTAIVFLLCSTLFAQHAAPTYGWKKVVETTTELDPMALMKPEAAADSRTRVKFVIEADSGVFFGVLPAQTVQQVFAHNLVLRTQHFQQMKCSRVGIVKGEFECVLEQGETYLVRDKRAEGSAMMGTLGAMSGNPNIAERATKPNKVHLTIYEWTCIENCRSTNTP